MPDEGIRLEAGNCRGRDRHPILFKGEGFSYAGNTPQAAIHTLPMSPCNLEHPFHLVHLGGHLALPPSARCFAPLTRLADCRDMNAGNEAAFAPPLIAIFSRTPYRPATFFPLPSTTLSAILSVDIEAIARGGKQQGLAACVGLYHWRGGRTPTGRATVRRWDPADDRHECIMMNMCQGCGMATLCVQQLPCCRHQSKPI
jgi:hypothetical protein